MEVVFCPECHREAYRIKTSDAETRHFAHGSEVYSSGRQIQICVDDRVMQSIPENSARNFRNNSIVDSAGHKVIVDLDSTRVRGTLAEIIESTVPEPWHYPEEPQNPDAAYYVSVSGSDSNNGTSLATPWKTIGHAASIMKAGDTAFLLGGTYNETITITKSGTSSNPITFTNYNGQTVIIDGTGINTPGIFIISNSNYVSIIGLNIQNATGATFDVGVLVTGNCSNVILQYLTIYNTNVSGIYASSSWSGYVNPATVQNLLIDGCTIHHTNISQDSEAISLENVANFEVRHNTVYDMVYAAGAGIDAKFGSNNGSIHDNDVSNCPGAPCIYADAAGHAISNISIYNNKIHDGGPTGVGICIADEHGVTTLTGINIYNNIIFNCQRGIAIYDYKTISTSPTYNFTFINNTLYQNGDSEIYLAPGSGEFSGSIIRNNIIYAKSNGILFGGTIGTGVTADHNLFYNCPIVGSGISGNPLFNNPTTDFSLQVGSPAIGMGSSTSAPATDIIGTTRASPPCIGAYEYASGTVPPAVTTNAAYGVTSSYAALSATLTTLGSVSPVTVSFDLGLDTNYTMGNYAGNPSSITSAPTTFTTGLGGLTAGTTYHYRAKAVAGSNTVYGSDMTFTTTGGFVHGTPRTAVCTITVTPAVSGTCQVELWLTPDGTTKKATSGKITFTSGNPVSCPITMPAAGVYSVYVDIYYNSLYIKGFVGSQQVTVI